MGEENKPKDYPEVQFRLLEDEGKSEEQIQKEIEELLKERELLFMLNGIPLPGDDKKEENSNEHPRRTR